LQSALDQAIEKEKETGTQLDTIRAERDADRAQLELLRNDPFEYRDFWWEGRGGVFDQVKSLIFTGGLSKKGERAREEGEEKEEELCSKTPEPSSEQAENKGEEGKE
jgi:hypothetical protein